MQKITFDLKAWIIYISIAVLLGLMISCRTARDNKAVNRVLNNNDLTNKVGRVWEKSNPCVIDTVVQFKNGKETVRYDTLWNDPEPFIQYDTTTKIKTVTDYKTIVKYINKTDTILIDKTDVRRLNLQIADNDKLKAENDQLKADKSDLQKKVTKFKLLFYGLLVVIGGLTFLKIYLK